MELTTSDFIQNSLMQREPKKRFLSYKELRDLAPVEVNDNLELTNSKDNVDLFQKYNRNSIALLPIKRVSKFKQRDEFPSRVLLEMTSLCNLNCTMCPRTVLTRPQIHMEPELFKKCVDQLDEKGINGLWIYNIGESILHPQFHELLDYVSEKKNLGPIWHSSNGMNLSSSFSDMIINSNVSFMNMSVNADSNETFKKIAPTGNWDRVTTNFLNFIQLKNDSNKRRPFSRVQIIDQECAKDDINKFFAKYYGKANIIAVNRLEAFSGDVKQNNEFAGKREKSKEKKCNRVSRSDMFIFSNGETTFCDTDFNGKLSLGNVKNQSIQEIWTSTKRKDILKLNREKRLAEVDLCKDCMDFDL